MKEIITIGTQIDTVDGYIVITSEGRGANTVNVDEYTIVWDDENDTDTGEYNKTSRLLTLNDIARRMKEVDGRNHDIRFEKNTEEA